MNTNVNKSTGGLKSVGESSDSFKINYPAIYAGASATKINFYSGKPDLFNLYKPGEERGQRICFVSDSEVSKLPTLSAFFAEFNSGKCGSDISVIIDAGESNKTIQSVLEITGAALDAGFGRNDLFVAVGGGVICDITGFAASIFKRGAAVNFVPTTLLAMVDAAIGGKTGCDFNSYKNMIGAFFPACRIDFYTDFVKSLSDAQYRSGLAEALKTALLYDRRLFEIFKNESEKIKERDADTVYEIINICARAKSAVVEQDFTEKNIRAYLNFGHTFAHALETLAGLGAVTHGDAVAWGMGRALSLSLQKGFCTKSYKDEVFSVLEKCGWVTSALPPLIKEDDADKRLLDIMHKDKKNTNSKVKLILQKDLCSTFSAEIEDSDILSVLR